MPHLSGLEGSCSDKLSYVRVLPGDRAPVAFTRSEADALCSAVRWSVQIELRARLSSKPFQLCVMSR
jgi:hypothetical protein